MAIKITELIPIHKIYQAAGFDIRFVGGCVRDTLLGILPHDYDLATPMPAEQGIALLKQHGYTVVPTGLAHGTFTLIIDKIPYEITTLRRDISTDGRRATIAYTDNWEEDALRRDFTVNALYMDFDGKIYDYTTGQQDLAAGIVRFIGNPVDRINEDYLRILRFFRFHERFATSPVSNDLKVIFTQLAPKIKTLSAERITQEFFLILSAKSPIPDLKIMAECQILQQFLETFDLLNLQQLIQIETSLLVPTNPLRRFSSLNCKKHRLRLSNKENSYLTLIRMLQNALENDSPYYLAYKFGLANLLDTYLLKQDTASWKTFNSLDIPPFPINGHDLKAIGINDGTKIGIALEKAEKIWSDSKYSITKNQLLMLLTP